MTKSLFVDPKAVRGAEQPIRFPEIPVNVYQKTVKDELGNFTTEEFLHIYRDMCYIREFETMLNLIKTTSEYQGVSYTHPGPAHLGIGLHPLRQPEPSDRNRRGGTCRKDGLPTT